MRSALRMALPLALLLLGAAAQAEVKIAFVDMQRALLEVEDGKKAKSQLETMKTQRQGQLDAQQDELRKMQKDLEAQSEFMTAEVKNTKEKDFREKLGKLQLTYAQLQQELAKEEAQLTKGIFQRMGRILQEIGEKEGYSMIFEKTESSLLWAQRHLDLTNDLIRKYNAGEGKQPKK